MNLRPMLTRLRTRGTSGMYGIGGERELTERTLDHLSGYRGARPVRMATTRGTSVSTTSGECCWICQKLLSFAGPLHLYAEEIDAATGQHLGNFPQAFTHLALIEAVSLLIAAEPEDDLVPGR